MANESPQNSTFKQHYRCYPVSFIDKPHLENGDKIIMPPSALDRLASLTIDYPILFELRNPSAERMTHCGVLEFIADEGLIYLPNWMMENMLIQEGGVVQLKNVSLSKGTYVKLQPHTKDFLDISNPKAILETSLRNYSCLTTGDMIMVPYNNKKYYINIVETKPSFAVSVIETDCEVDFAPPLDYIKPEQPVKSHFSNDKRAPEVTVEEEPTQKMAKINPFTGSARRLDGKPSKHSDQPAISPMLKQHQLKDAGDNGSKPLDSASDQHSRKLVFGSKMNQPSIGSAKVFPKESGQDPLMKVEKPKFQAFTGKKYSLI